MDSADSRKSRKRIQNRVNQRAHRLRLQAQSDSRRDGKRPFKVQRWRVDELAADDASTAVVTALITPPEAEVTTPQQSKNRDCRQKQLSQAVSTVDGSSARSNRHFKLPMADNLLHLIHFNIFRAMQSITSLLDVTTLMTDPSTGLTLHSCVSTDCGRMRTLQVLDPTMPANLMPTSSQARDFHSHWIDKMPFPQLRDNLIKYSASFDHADFMQDMVGSLYTPLSWRRSFSGAPPPRRQPLVAEMEDTDEMTSGCQGFIVWGDAHVVANWEATPSFLMKWAWALEGCEELVEVSNRWRLLRGEEPMRLFRPAREGVSGVA
ncbi:hypothetical protein C8034_v010350 [Colletotrichum sidae]|uniref:BZIP domain-containing protein n=1 Tax=Colletotrichum sidae TaxID=1347389 RepID=A0A4R8T1D3_9PEZI|nr:hypothetical protein C8034_v010350 [Colletotrichum sidae]